MNIAAPGALAHRLQNPNGCKGAPKWLKGSGKVFGRSRQLLLNKGFDPNTPSMRKVDNEEEKKRGGTRK